MMTAPEDTANAVVRMLLDIEAIRFSTAKPFRWSSGWLSPVYCDSRLALSYPDIRSAVRKELAAAVTGHFGEATCIAGVATAGVPQGVLVADTLGLPFLYVRSKPKDHGLGNMIEGRVLKDQKVAVVEDLVSTGASSLQAIAALRQAGMKPVGLVCIFSYGLHDAEKNFADAQIPVVALSDYGHLLQEATRRNLISQAALATLKAWRVDPAGWLPASTE